MTNPSRQPCAHNNGSRYEHSPVCALESADAAGAIRHGMDLPTWMDITLPWGSSTLLHLAVGLIVLFLVLVIRPHIVDDSPTGIVIPTAIPNEPSERPGDNGGFAHPGPGGNPLLENAQDRVKEIFSAKGWADQQGNLQTASFLAGHSSQNIVDTIVRGSLATTGGIGIDGTGTSNAGEIAPYGTVHGGNGLGPKGFFGLAPGGPGGAQAITRIVYLLDHSGSLLDNFNFLQKELKRSTADLYAFQYFGVIVFAGTEEGTQILTPGNSLVRATKENTRSAGLKMDRIVAQGRNDDELLPFLDAFQKAFAMHPQVIYFLTDGRFDPQLIKEVARLNQDKAVRINTIAFVRQEDDYFDQMRAISRQSGGTFKFVSEREVAGPAQ